MAKNYCNRIVWLDAVRIAAMLAVVSIHVIAEKWYDLPIKGTDWQILNLYDGMVRWGVPVFVMISGTLFLSTELSFNKLYRKKIWRLLMAFVGWSLIYAVVDYINGCGLVRAIVHFVHGHNHMWYIFMIVGVYMVVPILKRIVYDEQLMNYFMLLCFIFSFVVPQFIAIVTMINPALGDFFLYFTEKASIYLPLGYTGYFVLGYYLAYKELTKKTEYLLYSLGGGKSPDNCFGNCVCLTSKK